MGVGSVLGAALVFPYLVQLIPKLKSAPAPLWILVVGQSLQGGVLAFLLGWLGLTLGATLGLDSPILRAWVYRQPKPLGSMKFLPISATIGLVTGIGLCILDWFALWPHQPMALKAQALAPMPWTGFLAAFYGGMDEEVLTRLCLTTVLVWLLFKATRSLDSWVYVTAIIIGALAFAAGHLPTVAQLAPLTTFAVIRTLVLNGVAGVVFGLLYWKRGLEQAMVAHFCADLVLHVVAPAMVR